MPRLYATRPPYGGYAILLITFTTLLSFTLWFLARKTTFGWIELFLLIVATHEVTNILATDRVTSVFRRPFIDLMIDDSGNMVERPAERGLRRALGELVTCPFCLGPWVALTLGTFLALFPISGEIVLGLFAAVAGSDLLHHTRRRLKN